MRVKIAIIHLCIVLPFLSTNATAAAQMFAGYDQFCGVPFVVTPDPQGASSALDPRGQPIIYVDPSVMSNWSMSRMFVLAHECGHIKLGHLLPRGQWFRRTSQWATKQQELAADCWATQQLVRIGDTSDLRRMLIQFSKQGPAEHGGYPSGYERANNAARCASINIRTAQPFNSGDPTTNTRTLIERHHIKARPSRGYKFIYYSDKYGGFSGGSSQADACSEAKTKANKSGTPMDQCVFMLHGSDVKNIVVKKATGRCSCEHDQDRQRYTPDIAWECDYTINYSCVAEEEKTTSAKMDQSNNFPPRESKETQELSKKYYSCFYKCTGESSYHHDFKECMRAIPYDFSSDAYQHEDDKCMHKLKQAHREAKQRIPACKARCNAIYPYFK